MDEKTFGSLMKRLIRVYYREQAPDATTTQEIMAAYWDALDDLTDAEFIRAVAEVIRTKPWFPKPAELREIARPPRDPEHDYRPTNVYQPIDESRYPQLPERASAASRTPDEQAAWEAEVRGRTAAQIEAAAEQHRADTQQRRQHALDALQKERKAARPPRLIDTYDRREEADRLLDQLKAKRAAGQVMEPPLTDAERAREDAIKSGKPFNVRSLRRP